jgi:hypothetical protein
VVIKDVLVRQPKIATIALSALSLCGMAQTQNADTANVKPAGPQTTVPRSVTLLVTLVPTLVPVLMLPHQTVPAVKITPRWLVVHVRVSHTGMALTAVTTLEIVTLSVMAVTAQPLLTVTTVSCTLHGAQDSVPVTTHMLARNVTTDLMLKPQPSNSSPNRTTAMTNMVMDTA